MTVLLFASRLYGMNTLFSIVLQILFFETRAEMPLQNQLSHIGFDSFYEPPILPLNLTAISCSLVILTEIMSVADSLNNVMMSQCQKMCCSYMLAVI